MPEDTEMMRVEDFLAAPAPAASPPANGANGHHAGALDFSALSPFDSRGQVSIDIGIDHLPTLTGLCWQAIAKENNPPVLFKRANQIVRVQLDKKKGLFLQPVTADILRNELAKWAHWHKNQMKFVKPPIEVIRDVLASREINLPDLRTITGAPVFAPDGSLSLAPGYNEKSESYYAPVGEFEPLLVPEAVTAEDVKEANRLICEEVLVDFPFATAADRDNAVALFLLPFAREMIEGPTPNHLIESSMNGSGKGKLANALILPAVGQSLGIVSDPKDERELAKEITTQLLDGKQVIFLDNFERLNSSSLAAAWTGEVWDKRILGSQSTAKVEIRAIWVTTGKNVQMTSEMARRCLRIRIAPTTDRPEERTGWRHPALLAWCREHRGELVRAAHVMIRWWIQQGRPAFTGRVLGSFEDWARVMGGILECCGYKNFLGNYREFQGRADSERNSRSAFCATWYEWSRLDFPRRQYVTASDLMPIAEGVEGLPITGSSPRAQLISLGRWLQSNADVYVEHSEEMDEARNLVRQFRIGRGSIRDGKQQWFIEMISEEIH